MKSVWIVSAQRTPIGKFGGGFKGFNAVDLGVLATQKTIEQSVFDTKDVDLTIFGHGRQGGSGPNPSRQIAIRSGLNESTTSYTVNQACASSLLAIKHAFYELQNGNSKAIIAGGIESMSSLPHYLFESRWGKGYGNIKGWDANYKDGFFCPLANQLMGLTAETLAKEAQIDRQMQEEFAIQSHNKAQNASNNGVFKNEMFNVKTKKSTITKDETIRENPDPKKLAKLPTVFLSQEEGGTITPGTSCSMADGAASMLLVSDTSPPPGALAKIVGFCDTGVAPTHMGIGPVSTCQKLEKITNWKTSSYQHVELNEAFAAQVLACQQHLNVKKNRLNPYGGAIALGHPIGCTGARIATTLSHSIKRMGKGTRGLATLCVSGGMGFALALESC